MICIILLGQSNSGKSTIGKAVASRYDDVSYVSSGDIARKMSLDVQKRLNNGELAPEDKMRKEILYEITHCKADLILDGFPRFSDQYHWIKKNTDNVKFVYVLFEVPYQDILTRAMSRRRCDDNSIARKMEWYDENTVPMIQEIISNGEDVYIINNGNNDSVYENTERLATIIGEHRDHADNS